MRRAAEVAAPANRFSFAVACKSRHCQAAGEEQRIVLPGDSGQIFSLIKDYLYFICDADYL
jgi:hypothetical protein